jgi:uncharacterized protein YqeY
VGEDALRQRIRAEMTAALRAGDKIRLGTLRMLQAAVTNREKDVLHELTDDEVREVAGKEVKKRTESIEAFAAAGRTELVERERAEREILADFAPEQLSETQVDALIDEAIASTGASTPQELGKVMGVVMGAVKGRADGAVVQAKVRARLGG